MATSIVAPTWATPRASRAKVEQHHCAAHNALTLALMYLGRGEVLPARRKALQALKSISIDTSVAAFTPDHPGTASAHTAHLDLQSGPVLSVRASRLQDKVEVTRFSVAEYIAFKMTAAEARALGAELIGAADATDAALASTREVPHG